MPCVFALSKLIRCSSIPSVMPLERLNSGLIGPSSVYSAPIVARIAALISLTLPLNELFFGMRLKGAGGYARLFLSDMGMVSSS